LNRAEGDIKIYHVPPLPPNDPGEPSPGSGNISRRSKCKVAR
jgi:hypothetical protein